VDRWGSPREVVNAHLSRLGRDPKRGPLGRSAPLDLLSTQSHLVCRAASFRAARLTLGVRIGVGLGVQGFSVTAVVAALRDPPITSSLP
jgi:hypothetical protein